jgi:hypothetical protein
MLKAKRTLNSDAVLFTHWDEQTPVNNDCNREFIVALLPGIRN